MTLIAAASSLVLPMRKVVVRDVLATQQDAAIAKPVKSAPSPSKRLWRANRAASLLTPKRATTQASMLADDDLDYDLDRQLCVTTL